jgi:putative transposase
VRIISVRFGRCQPGDFGMKKSRFSEQQIAFILKQAEDVTTVEEVCRKAGISIQTYYRWRSKCGGLMPS